MRYFASEYGASPRLNGAFLSALGKHQRQPSLIQGKSTHFPVTLGRAKILAFCYKWQFDLKVL
jgi:hypothetical protein